MASQQPSYDKIAKRYDFLSRLIFFKTQVRAQTGQLHYLVNCSRLLIVGGGTGWILKDLNTAVVNPIEIVFVETSIEMINLAKKIVTHHKVNFVHQDIEAYNGNVEFDAVLTPFLFDNFDLSKAEKVFGRIDSLLLANGIWIYVDFHLNKKSAFWKKLMLKSMHWFFRLINVVQVDDLMDMEPFFKQSYATKNERFYYSNFIKSVVYKKR